MSSRRLQWWLAGVLVLLLAGSGTTLYRFHRLNRLRQIDTELQIRAAALTALLRRPGPPGGEFPPPPFDDFGPGEFRPPPPHRRHPPHLALASEAAALFPANSPRFYYAIWDRDGAILSSSPNSPAALAPPSGFERDALPHLRATQETRAIVHCSGFGECALAGRFVAGDEQDIRQFGFTVFGAGAAVLAIVWSAAWWLHSRAVAPLESAFFRQKLFTAEVAHELRTPLAAIIAETQTVLARDRTATEYRDAVEADLATAQQMRRLTESILDLARLEAGSEPLARRTVDLAEAARRSVQRILPLASQKRVSIVEDYSPAPVSCIPERLDQVIGNLLSNAIHYNRPAGRVSIATRSSTGFVELTVADTGIGIPAADLPHVFQRFYRVDKIHPRPEGRIGLGLAICKASRRRS